MNDRAVSPARKNLFNRVTPNVFIGGPAPNQPRFPLKARGNDGEEDMSYDGVEF
jgi:hypothetical protein